MKGLPQAKRVAILVTFARYAFAVIGIAALGYWTSVSLHASLFQKIEAHRFARTTQRQITFETKDAWNQPAPPEGSVVASLAIPRLGLSTVVVEGVADSDLKLAPGHIEGAAEPGESGNIGIAGHRDTFFRPLRSIHKDDVIELTTLHEDDWYRVDFTQVVKPDDVQVLSRTSGDTLTLVTCYPFYYVGSAPNRFIVRAERLRARN